ncbi:hypothetical protein [Anatilimnocola floriformis]|uniref:hypothetical protein n=1 Tax=Anatilimnocola floriformis TaxID=2948575 RepID=UPI0020C3E8AF|nr:hypothetical protein [Anatilimnocola floriformis]
MAHSRQNRSTSRRLFLEQLEGRTVFAGGLGLTHELPPEGFQAAVKLEIVDVAGNPITSVRVGEKFRVLARLLVPAGTEPFAGAADVNFPSELVVPVNDPHDFGLTNARILNGEIDEAAKLVYWTKTPDIFLSKTFQATAEGTITFVSSAPDQVGSEILFTGLTDILDFAEVSFGSATVEVAGVSANPILPADLQPEFLRTNLKRIDFQLYRVAEEYGQHLQSGSPEAIQWPNSTANGWISIIARTNEAGHFGTEAELQALADSLVSEVGAQIASTEKDVSAWIPIARIRDLSKVTGFTSIQRWPSSKSPPADPPVIDDVLPEPTVPLPPNAEAGYLAEVELEVVDLNGNVITTVEIGQEFRLRARLLVPAGTRAFSGNGDFLFDENLLDLLLDRDDPGLKPAIIHPGEIDEAGRVMYQTAEGTIMLSAKFRATATGTATFTSNRAETDGFEILYTGVSEHLDPAKIKYGTTTVEIVAASGATKTPPVVPPSSPSPPSPTVVRPDYVVIGAMPPQPEVPFDENGEFVDVVPVDIGGMETVKYIGDFVSVSLAESLEQPTQAPLATLQLLPSFAAAAAAARFASTPTALPVRLPVASSSPNLNLLILQTKADRNSALFAADVAPSGGHAIDLKAAPEETETVEEEQPPSVVKTARSY